MSNKHDVKYMVVKMGMRNFLPKEYMLMIKSLGVNVITCRITNISIIIMKQQCLTYTIVTKNSRICVSFVEDLFRCYSKYI